jgi:AcrR family transcriptional regulator
MPAKSQNERADRTRAQLIQAAESLIVEKGFENVSVREIVRKAGQKNESALQYHFKDRGGLIVALKSRRSEQLEARRSALFTEFMQTNQNPDVRLICALLVQAPFQLCREDKEFRAYLGEFGQRLIASNQIITQVLSNRKSNSQSELTKLLRKLNRHLDDELFTLRLEAMSSFVLMSLSRRARDKGSFRGRRAELFISNLIDQMAAMLTAPVSSATAEFKSPQ